MSSSAPVGVLAVGLGDRLLRLLGLLREQHGETCELRALCDESPAALERARGILGPDLPVYDDCARMLADFGGGEGASWTWIGSRNDRHRDHCVAALEAGQHVFCEKPLAITLEHCLEIRAASERAGRTVATGFVLRSAPLYRRLAELVSAGEIGDPISFEGNEHLAPGHGGYIMRNWRRQRRYAGSYFLEKCCHDVDVLRFVLGRRVKRVASFGGLSIFVPERSGLAERLAHPEDDAPLFRSWPAWEDVDPFTSEKDIEDHQVVLLEIAGDGSRPPVRGTFASNACAALPERRLLLHGTEGSIEAELITGTLRHRRLGRTTREREERFPGGLHGGGDSVLVDELAAAMTQGTTPSATLEAALESAVVCFAIDEALRTGTVVDLEPWWRRLDRRAKPRTRR